MSYCKQRQTVSPTIECGDPATFVAWTKDDPAAEEIEISCTQHLAKAVIAAQKAMGGVGYVRVAPIPQPESLRVRQAREILGRAR